MTRDRSKSRTFIWLRPSQNGLAARSLRLLVRVNCRVWFRCSRVAPNRQGVPRYSAGHVEKRTAALVVDAGIRLPRPDCVLGAGLYPRSPEPQERRLTIIAAHQLRFGRRAGAIRGRKRQKGHALRERLEVAPAFERLEHGDFVGVFEISADGNTHTDSRYAHAERLEQFREIDGRGFAFGGGVRGDDDFLNCAALEALDERFDLELFGTASGKRRERAAENVVHAAVGARFFDSENVVRFLDDADAALIAIRADAVQTGVGIGDVVADGALADFFLGVANGVGESQRVLGCGAEQMKGEALGGFLANAGEMLEFVDETFDWSGEIGHERCVAQGRSGRKPVGSGQASEPKREKRSGRPAKRCGVRLLPIVSSHIEMGSGSELLNIGAAEFEAEAVARETGAEKAVVGLDETVEEDALDALMIVEIFKIARGACDAAEVHVNGRRGMRRERDGAREALGIDIDEPGDAAAACGIRLENVDGFRIEHAAKVEGIVSVFAGGDIHSGGAVIANQPQAFQIIRTDGLFEAADVELLLETAGKSQRLLAAVGAVGVNEEGGMVSDGLASDTDAVEIAAGLPPDFHFHHGEAFVCPAAELVAQLLVGV